MTSAGPPGGAVRTGAGRAWRGVRWYLREFTGEARWDDYLRHCGEHGHTPMSRREFERARTDAAEKNPISRCC